jgi:hypothetical protein
MRIIAGGLLALAMVGLAAVAWADEISWRPAGPPLAPAVQHDQPVAISRVPADGIRTVTFQIIEPVPVSLEPQLPERTEPSPVLLKETERTDLSPVTLKEIETPPATEPTVRAFAIRENAVPPARSASITLAPPEPLPGGAAPTLYPTESWSRHPGPGVLPPDQPSDGDALEPAVHGPERFYGGVDYLLWWIQGDRLPVLLTTGQPADQGILGRPGTTVLFGGSAANNNPNSGVRASFGWWCDCDHQLGIDVGGFVLPRMASTFTANSNEFPVLARPFFRINPGPNFGESRELATFPGLSQGSVSIDTTSDLWGVELNLRHCLWCGCVGDGVGYRLDIFGGPRFLGLTERLTMSESLTGIVPGASPALPNGGSAFVFDRFSTANYFYGGQVGMDLGLQGGRWSLDMLAKVALGYTHQVVGIDGSQVQTDNVLGTRSFQGGLLALPTNIGNFTRNRFTVVPEVGLNVGYQLTEHMRFVVGYSFLYWSSVVRPGGQIDRNLDATNIPNFITADLPTGQRRPAALLQATDFWAQGINFGLEIRY